MFISNMFATKSNTLELEDMINNMNKVTKQDVIDIAKNIAIEKVFFLGGDINA